MGGVLSLREFATTSGRPNASHNVIHAIRFHSQIFSYLEKSKCVKNRTRALVDRGQRRKQGPQGDNGPALDSHKRNDEEWDQESFVNIKGSLIPRPVNGIRGHPPGPFQKRASTVIAGVTTAEGHPWHNSTLWTGPGSNPLDWKTPMIPRLTLGVLFGKRWLWGIILGWEHPEMESA
ncbi:hypothetical protein TNIN_259661 [Trichonephila inaurata madagascariensis]|uniref:Uncharacterized protein n=1 Tax=Trichonephila inaurata madagascariensis TaxID=2747483 RepID=A0A8X6WV99_9ARAC|nr:hypothetical protein TNIN_259661 [Trichonephila inaurata madagascariensis]